MALLDEVSRAPGIVSLVLR